MSAHVLVFVVMQWLPLPFGMTFWLMFAIVSPWAVFCRTKTFL